MRRDPPHAEVLDANLFPEKGDFLLEAVALGPVATLSAGPTSGPAVGGGQGVAGERDDVEDGGANTLWPASGQGQVEIVTLKGHGSLPEEPVRRSREA